ncbi:Ribulose-phosphate 3-epimerase [compost metagenome]
MRKITQIREWANEVNPDLLIEVDGGVSEATAPLVVGAGADVLVAGNAVFGRSDRAAAILEIREAAEAALR